MTSQPIEARLAAIEAKLGILHGKPSNQGENVQKRLDDLKALYEATTDSSFRESSAESSRLMADLSAGTALSHQTSVSTTPLYYRRQEILSSSDDLKADFDQLAEVMNLILVSQQPRDGSVELREEDLTQAPIVTVPPVSEENTKRLDVLRSNIGELSTRAQAVAGRVDALLKLHYSLAATASEKIVIAEEQVAAKEQGAK